MSLIYVDSTFISGPESDAQARRVGSRNNHQWCHMWSEDVEALHKLASKIGMRREWFQDRRGFPHYDLVPSKRVLAIKLGAVEIELKEWIREKKGYPKL